jgi:hypothetical protein
VGGGADTLGVICMLSRHFQGFCSESVIGAPERIRALSRPWPLQAHHDCAASNRDKVSAIPPMLLYGKLPELEDHS